MKGLEEYHEKDRLFLKIIVKLQRKSLKLVLTPFNRDPGNCSAAVLAFLERSLNLDRSHPT